MKKITLPYPEAIALIKIVQMAKVSGSKNVLRARFTRLFSQSIADFEKERDRLAEEHAERDAQGNPIVAQEGMGKSIKLKHNGMPFRVAFQDLINQSPITLEALEGKTEQALEFVYEILTSELCPEISGEDSIRYGSIMKEIERGTES